MTDDADEKPALLSLAEVVCAATNAGRYDAALAVIDEAYRRFLVRGDAAGFAEQVRVGLVSAGWLEALSR